jgi:alkylated DNA repair dioxygenase AlkB
MPHRDDAPVNLSLFAPEVPDGFEYRPDFVTPGEQSDLLEHIAMIEFSNFEMRGVVARRRVAFFGSSYDDALRPAGEVPEFLHPVRARAAVWAGVAPEAFEMALINEYRPGAPIGWHRDAPQYGIIAGISLASPCRIRFRPYVRPSAGQAASRPAPRKTTHEVLLEPRSAYLITGASRQQYEHSIPAVAALRYSITFRTRRR